MPAPVKLAGRTAVITGAASGIGRALAQRLSRQGSPVVIADVFEAGLKETADSLTGPVLARILDVSDAGDVTRFAAEVAAWRPGRGPQPGRLGAVFNNAGVAVGATVLDSVPANDQWLWDINFHGVVNGTRAFLPLLVEQDSGVMVNTSSVFGLAGIPGQSAYCASKFAVRGFTDSLRQEVRGTGVRAVTVHPGGIKTNIARSARITSDPLGLGRSPADVVKEFETVLMTSPEKAAQVIQHGVERGKGRILIGPDAHVFDVLTRITPTHYWDIMEPFEARMRALRNKREAAK
jgi:NAD(P)-dependent dehydrogenase (short-subunit alcohol dehydrogenase family)